MSSTSPLIVDPAVFAPSAISAESHAFNQKLMEIMSTGPKWYEVGPEKYRRMRAAGETPLPAAVHLSSASNFSIPSRDRSRRIPCRILKPESGASQPSSVFMHIHGGGWVLQDEKSQDPVLQEMANNLGIICLSVGYRLAPEHPYPAGPKDCFDVAKWLVVNSQSTFGAELGFIGGESAGAHLALITVLHLLQHADPKISSFSFKGLLLHYGVYSMTWTPSVYSFRKPHVLILDRDIMDHYLDAFLPNMTPEQMKDPALSPLYADLMSFIDRSSGKTRLPPALFTCGTEDCLLDDTIFMATKWMMAGAGAQVLVVPGGPHGYIMFPRDTPGSGAKEGMEVTEKFVRQMLGTTSPARGYHREMDGAIMGGGVEG